MSPTRFSAVILGLAVLCSLLLVVLGVAAGFQISDGEGRRRLIDGGIVLGTIGVIVSISMFGLVTRSRRRTQSLQLQFPHDLVLTVRKTDDLETQLVILNGKSPGGGIRPDNLGSYYSCLVIGSSGAAIWTGGAHSLTQTWHAPVERIRGASSEPSSKGRVLRVVVDKQSVPVVLLFPIVKARGIGFVRPTDAEMEDVLQKLRAQLRVN